jgi:hypothetical protein
MMTLAQRLLGAAMAKVSNVISGFIGEGIALVIGWLLCISVLIGAYELGYWAAPHVGWVGNRETLGLLSSIAVIWLYEYRHFEDKLDRLD